MDDVALSVKSLNCFYGDLQVCEDVSFDAKRNRVLAIIGPSGCGKSTLLLSLNKTLELTEGARAEGEILLEGKNIDELSLEDLRREVGLVTQQPVPFPFSVEKNISYALRYLGKKNKTELHEIAETELKKVGLFDELKGDLKRSAYALSGGQQQRLCIARALAVEPKILLLDEPCSALDVASTQAIEKALTDLKSEITVILVTHNLAQAQRIADDVICVKEGKVVWNGEAKDLFNDEASNKELLNELYA